MLNLVLAFHNSTDYSLPVRSICTQEQEIIRCAEMWPDIHVSVCLSLFLWTFLNFARMSNDLCGRTCNAVLSLVCKYEFSK